MTLLRMWCTTTPLISGPDTLQLKAGELPVIHGHYTQICGRAQLLALTTYFTQRQSDQFPVTLFWYLILLSLTPHYRILLWYRLNCRTHHLFIND